MATAINIHDLTFTYKGADHPALDQVSLSVAAGECLILTGPAGAGKSTLCHCLNGLVPQVQEGRLEGDILVGGKDVSQFRVQTLAKTVGLVMQDPEVQIVGRTVAEDIGFGPRNFLVEAASLPNLISTALHLTGLKGYENRQTADLSGGEKQRLTVAGILAMETPLLVLDEPASELDPAGRNTLYRNLARLNRENGVTLVIVEHRADDLNGMADRVVSLDRGSITGIAEVDGSNLPPRSHALPRPPEIPSPDINTPAVIKVRQLNFNPGRPVLSHVNLTIRQKDFIALMGHNGAGKTTLAKHLNGLIPPPEGTVKFEGHDVSGMRSSDITRAVGFVFQNPDHQIFESTVAGEVGAGLVHRRLPKSIISERVDEALKVTGLTTARDVHPFTLGKGLRQLVALASVIILKPEVLVVDEPTTGLDAEGSARVMDILTRLHNSGTSILFITHDLELAAAHARRLVVMNQGSILMDEAMDKAFLSPDKLLDAGIFHRKERP
ncbi:MAG: energy-coupling factor ABC transporter ATP-binding protein [Desulfobacterales bacterium]|nr:energy-coupling factor ABC transporter ATP-binding protein [Desulfobacterales bacterium]